MAESFRETNKMNMRPIYADGYKIPLGTVFTVTKESDETNDFYFGTVDSVTIRTATRATIAATFREAKEDYKLMLVLSGLNPEASGVETSVKVYEPESVEVALIRNIWNADKSDYLGGEFYGSASCLIPVATGDASALGERTLTFTCDTPLEVMNRGFAHEVVALSGGSAGPWTGNLACTAPTQVPAQFSGPQASCHAVFVAVGTASGTSIRKKGRSQNIKPIVIATGTVSSAGLVTINKTDMDEAVMTVADDGTGKPVFAQVAYIAGATGVTGAANGVLFEGLYSTPA